MLGRSKAEERVPMAGVFRRVGGKRSYFEKTLKKELFRMTVEKGTISNERPRRSYLGSH